MNQIQHDVSSARGSLFSTLNLLQKQSPNDLIQNLQYGSVCRDVMISGQCCEGSILNLNSVLLAAVNDQNTDTTSDDLLVVRSLA